MNDGERNIKILAVDDDQLLRTCIIAFLEDSGYETLEAENGRVALDVFRNEDPDLVLLDLRMPEMDGIELLPILVKESPDTPVIIVSGMGTLDDSIQALRLGAWDYLTKPIHDFALLEHALSRALKQARLIKENQLYKKHLEDEVQKRTLQLASVNRALHTLSAGNEALVRATEENQLLKHICEVIKDVGGYAAAWVGYIENNKLCAKACNGLSDAENQVVELCAEKNTGRGAICPLSMACRGEVVIINDIQKEEVCSAYRDLLQGNSIRSVFAYPLEIKHEVFGVLAIYAEDANTFGKEEATLLQELGGDLTYGIQTLRLRNEREQAVRDREESVQQLEAAMIQSIGAIAMTLEKRDPYTSGHQQRVAGISVGIAQEMELNEEIVEGLKFGTLIHDIGKIYVPAEILNRPGKLTPEEFSLIKSHAQVGYDIIKDVAFPWPVAQMILQHHERIDGSGYPNGLKGDEIIMEAKIMAVADVIEAMSSHRPYRAGLGIEAALAEIEVNSGIAYDSTVVAATLSLFRDKGFTIDEWK